MILFAFDLETTGLDFVKDRPIEVGAILYSTTQRKCLESQGFLVKTDVPISAEITKLTGITQNAVNKFGYDSDVSLEIVKDMMVQADAVIGHNVVRFDNKMLWAWTGREAVGIPDPLWIDTYTDLPNAKPGTLTHMAADHGILNLFPHSALADCQTVLKLAEQYDIEKVVERAKSPAVVVQARVTFDTNHLAKKEKFRWYPDKKMWFKIMKEMDVEAFVKNAAFDVTIYRENIQEFLDL
jgi:DNA polymerase III alpha subunit (gram-positive type)